MLHLRLLVSACAGVEWIPYRGGVGERRRRAVGAPECTQRLIIAAGVIEAGLKVAMLVDVKRRPASHIRGSKWVRTLLAFVNFLGPAAYFVIGRRGAPSVAFERTRRS